MIIHANVGDKLLKPNNTTNKKSSFMQELIIKDKQKYLNENYPFEGTPEVSDKKLCIHCNSIIIVGNYKVYKDRNGFEFICCPNAPKCNGTVIDWVEID
jgi:hypothetical protein